MAKNSATVKATPLREERVRKLLDAACRVVAQYGFQEATLDRIAEEAQIAKGTIYLYFSSKEDLLTTAIEQGIEDFSSQLQAALAEEATPIEKLRCLIETNLELSQKNSAFFKTLLLERNFLAASPHHPEAAHMLDVYLNHIRFIEEILQEGVDAGALRPHNIEASAFALNEAMRGCFQQHALGLTSRTVAEDAEILFDLLKHGVLSPSFTNQ